ncbi:hypothetical protein SVIOM74S_06653 [Streptomyces violarus]
MRRQVKRACAATVATAAAVALAAGMTSPASANGEQTTAAAKHASVTAKHRITLITGDRVVLDAKGRVVGLERAKGREDIPVQIRKLDGHTLVIPADAARLVATGKLDQRLFDVTELNKSATRKAQKKGLKVIVGYQGSAAATKADVRDAGRLSHSLKTVNADAVQTPKEDAPELWDAVTNGDKTASGIAHVWLDGVRKASLDKSVPQIGAPKAWAAGYDGKGVKIAVLDTGVDATHPDLKGQVIGAKNFTTSPDTTDKVGHGTHVASIAAGTGAKSGGKYKGVAPGAKIINGKVLDDSGFGSDSEVLAGIEWAAAEGADVINMSLGGGDTPAIDPLEAAVNKLSEEKGVLFAIAAGNEGDFGEQTIGSPGSAAAALTVGAVDDKDVLADFSSRGPGLDGALKPDVTAPGVDITAASAPGNQIAQEVGENPAGYMSISGTSMATPHVAGAAALLKQQHPEWKYPELKGALTGSTKGGKYTPFEQGSGRIQVDKAIKQSVIANPSTVSFGVQQWPHTDDKPVTKELTYRNLGTKPVTLKLASTATNPKGQAAPAGFFKLGATSVTVPAGGKASVPFTVNTKLGGTVDGAYSSYVTATGGGQTVRTAAAVQREVESYDVTLKFVGRDGKPTKNYSADLAAVSGLGKGKFFMPYEEDGTVTTRVPKGGYVLNTNVRRDGVDRVQQMPQRRPDLLGPRRLLLLVLFRLRQVRQVGVLGAGQPQGARDRVEHLRRDVAPVALLQPCVVRHGHPGKLGQLLTAQPRNPAPPEVGQPHVLRLQPGAAGAQELAELGTPVQAPAGLRCGLLCGFGLFVHALQYSWSYAHEPDPASGTHAVRTQNRGLGRRSRVWHGGDRARSEHQKAAGHGTC